MGAALARAAVSDLDEEVRGTQVEGSNLNARQTERQTNSFIENSIDAGILLGGNGFLHAIMVARAVSRVSLAAYQALIIRDHAPFRSYPLSD